MNVNNHFFATGIGSLPFQEKEKAVAFVLECFGNDIPFWPQLPRRSFLESMHIQFSEGFPGCVIDNGKKNIIIDTKTSLFIEEFERCYNAINNDDSDYFAISQTYAAGFSEFVKQIKTRRYPFIKGQVIDV